MRIVHDLNEAFNKETSIALGFFDGVHLGHRAVIGSAIGHRAEGQEAVVFSFSAADAVPFKKRGAKWLTTSAQKAQKLAALGVDLFIEPPFAAISSKKPEEFANFLIRRLHVRHVTCGLDYRFGRGASGDVDDLRRLLAPAGAVVDCVTPVQAEGETISSTHIRELLANGDAAEAARLLGAPFAVDTPVVHGRGLGHHLGSPTANQRFPDNFVVPRYGVYATRVLVDGRAYAAVTNVGVKPTVGDALPGAETWILDFSGDLYNRNVETQFLQFLREEQKFDSLESLAAQIQRDGEAARTLFAR